MFHFPLNLFILHFSLHFHYLKFIKSTLVSVLETRLTNLIHFILNVLHTHIIWLRNPSQYKVLINTQYSHLDRDIGNLPLKLTPTVFQTIEIFLKLPYLSKFIIHPIIHTIFHQNYHHPSFP